MHLTLSIKAVVIVSASAATRFMIISQRSGYSDTIPRFNFLPNTPQKQKTVVESDS